MFTFVFMQALRNPSRLKVLLFLSVALNVAAFYIALRHQYFTKLVDRYSGKKEYGMLAYTMRLNLIDSFPIYPTDIVFAGDSQIEFFELQEMFHNISIKNRGVSGDETEGVMKRIQTICKGRPRKLFLEIGINDLRKGVSREDVFKNISSIIAYAQASSPSTKIYLNTIFPFHEKDSEVQWVNQKLAGLAKEKNLTMMDSFSEFYAGGGLKPAYDCGDHLHLNRSGYVKWTELLRPYVEE
jgi:hypothetical protein